MEGTWRRWILLLGSWCWIMTGWGQTDRATQWADSVLATLSAEEKVGQLFMITAYSNQDAQDYAFLESQIRRYAPGGLIFMQGTPEKQIELINRYQAASDLPLLIAQDAEWGPAMRLSGTIPYPRNMTLGAVGSDSLMYRLGRQMASDLKRVGVHMNFAPVVDINNNPRNPVINDRSYGEGRFNVARKGYMVMKGMQDAGVIACAKHFPGHGDTGVDSHVDLPVINHSLERLDTMEIYPFRRLIEGGVGAVMVAHLHIPALDNTPNRSASLSPRIVQSLLRERIGFDGLIITDALNMKGVTKYYQPGELALEALLAGNDMLLSPEDFPRSVEAILDALQSGRLSEAVLDAHLRRILLAKYQVGLHRPRRLSTTNLKADLLSPEADLLRKQLYESAITLAKNEGSLLPLADLEETRIAYVQVGGNRESELLKTVRIYAEVAEFYLGRHLSSADRQRLLQQLGGYNVVLVAAFGESRYRSATYGVTPPLTELVSALGSGPWKTALIWCGNPYALRFFGWEQAALVAYEDASEAQRAAGAAIFGGLRITGRLPVTASSALPEGRGIQIRRPIRFGFALPEEVGMDGRTLARIDSLAYHYINAHAMPGCQILLLRGNDIVYARGFGRTQYVEGEPIDPWFHSYDLASVTKVAATTISTMKLAEEGRLDLDAPIYRYLPEWRANDKGRLTARQLLQHTAGLPGWEPLFLDTYSDPVRKVIDRERFRFEPSPEFPMPVGPGLYARADVEDWVWQRIAEVELSSQRRVRYSDVGLMIMGHVIERITGQTLEQYAKRTFYQPLGMGRTWFLPGEKGLAQHCPPTETDYDWRHRVIQGYVHDPNAALLGGVAGHAGLFSNVYDLAKLMLMLKNQGSYGGKRYFMPVTIENFTRKQLSYSRKGLGWDKPDTGGGGPTSAQASAETYGHTGFTGTCVWVDPKADLVFLFLSNRTFPQASNKLLLRENVRIQIMDQAYEAMAVYQRQRRR